MTNTSELASKLGESEAIASAQESDLVQTDHPTKQVSSFQKPKRKTKGCLPGQQCDTDKSNGGNGDSGHGRT
ncbi:hypothetical protein NIES4103_09160 [Nostoc sp. NIES-4103]|nr:hypothetical protein NIES4103_09160 [Nostoc sp. NIES-4103]